MKKLEILKISFILRSDKKKTGASPILMQLYLDGRRAYIGTGEKVEIDHWDSQVCRMKGNTKKAVTLNHHLDMMKVDTLQIYHSLKLTQEDVTVDELRNTVLGKDETSIRKSKTLLDLCDLHNNYYSGLVGIEIGKITYRRYFLYKRRLKDFLNEKFNQDDIMLSKIKFSFALEYEYYLKVNANLHQNTLVKFIQYLNRVMDYGVTYEYIDKNVLSGYKVHYKETNKECLTDEELTTLKEKKLTIKRIEEVRDCLVFCCYTGYAYKDAFLLSPDHIVKGINGKIWIYTSRQKNDNVSNVPLLEPAIEIIEKYKNHPFCVSKNRLLPMKSNQKYNAYLKELADICGIKKPLTTHIARHTFATTVLLSNGVSIEATSKMLGHKSIKTTQIYGKIVESRVGDEMDKLSDKLFSAKQNNKDSNPDKKAQ